MRRGAVSFQSPREGDSPYVAAEDAISRQASTPPRSLQQLDGAGRACFAMRPGPPGILASHCRRGRLERKHFRKHASFTNTAENRDSFSLLPGCPDVKRAPVLDRLSAERAMDEHSLLVYTEGQSLSGEEASRVARDRAGGRVPAVLAR